MNPSRLFLLFILCALLQTTVSGQSRIIRYRTREPELAFRQAVQISFLKNELLITNLQKEDYDRVLIFDSLGTLAFQKMVRSPSAALDLTFISDGVYILQLRSSANRKEKTIKFLLRRS